MSWGYPFDRKAYEEQEKRQVVRCQEYIGVRLRTVLLMQRYFRNGYDYGEKQILARVIGVLKEKRG